MIHWAWLIPTVFVSFALGMLAMALCVAAGRAGDKCCVNCKHYAYYDGPLCGLRASETWLWEVAKRSEDWSCAEWEARDSEHWCGGRP